MGAVPPELLFQLYRNDKELEQSLRLLTVKTAGLCCREVTEGMGLCGSPPKTPLLTLGSAKWDRENPRAVSLQPANPDETRVPRAVKANPSY